MATTLFLPFIPKLSNFDLTSSLKAYIKQTKTMNAFKTNNLSWIPNRFFLHKNGIGVDDVFSLQKRPMFRDSECEVNKKKQTP